MNLTSLRGRRAIAALSSTAVLGGAGWILATSAAAAPTPLGLNSGGTTPVVGNFGYGTTATANAAYALKVSGADGTASVQLTSAPAGGTLAYNFRTGNQAANTTFTTVGTSDEVQTVTISGTPTGGTFTLTYAGQTTAGIAYNAAASAVQSALIALSNLDTGDVVVTGTGPYTVTFGGTLADTNVAQMTASGAGLTGGTSPAAAVTTATQGGTAPSLSSLGATPAVIDNLYVTGDVPGVYKFRIFQDTNASGDLDVADERTTELVEMTVHDTNATTSTTADDVAPVIAATTPVGIGLSFTPTITYSKSLSMTDGRGNSSTGLGARLAAVTFTFVNGGTDASGTGTISGITDQSGTDTAASYTVATSMISFPAALTPGAAGYVVLKSDFTSTLDVPATSYGTKTVEVQSNNVTAVTLEATDVVGTVKQTGTAVAVKNGTAAVTYKATVTDSDTDKSGNIVYFTLGGTDVASLTTNGTTVDAAGYVYSAVTNSDGVASLTVTDGASTRTSYTVQARSNGNSATALTATYAAAAANKFEITNSNAELFPTTGASSVAVKGKLLDQFGAGYQPTPSEAPSVTVNFDRAASSCTAVGSNDVTLIPVVGSGGAFTATYTPSSPTAGACDSFNFVYSGATTLVGALNYASDATVDSVTITAPSAGATPTLRSKASPNAAVGTTVSGAVLDATSTALPFASVSLSGDGVYFSTVNTLTTGASDDLTKSFSTTTNSSGVYTAYAWFTKPGTKVITATSGGETKTVSVDVSASIDPYKVVVNPVGGDTNSDLTVAGKVTDMLGNGVAGNKVDLTVDTSSLGSLDSGTVTTSSDGSFSTTFSTGDSEGGVVVTATLYDHSNTLLTSSSTLVPSALWLSHGGLTFENGDYQDTAQITITKIKPVVNAPSKDLGGGKIKLTGSYKPDTTVEIYAKPSGASSYSLIDTVETNSDGDWSKFVTVKKSTRFLIKAGGQTSVSDSVTVISTVKLDATSPRNNRVKLYANGTPAAKGTLTFWRIDGKDKKLATIRANSSGNGAIVVRAPDGKRTYKVTFRAIGTSAGSDTDPVRVK